MHLFSPVDQFNWILIFPSMSFIHVVDFLIACEIAAFDDIFENGVAQMEELSLCFRLVALCWSGACPVYSLVGSFLFCCLL